MPGHGLGLLVDGGQGPRLVADVAGHDGHDLPRVAGHVDRADALVDVRDRQGMACRRVGGDEDVAHPDEFHGLARVHLDDHLLGLLEEGGRVADRGGRDDPAVFQDADGLDDGHVHLAQEAVAQLLGHLAQVDVEEHRVARVDPLVDLFARLVGEALGDGVHLRPGLVQLDADGGARQQGQPEFLALLDPFGHGQRHRLGVPAGGEPARADDHAVLDVLGGLLGRGDFGQQFLVEDTALDSHLGIASLSWIETGNSPRQRLQILRQVDTIDKMRGPRGPALYASSSR